ncbi:hypothetical protein [Rhizorhapis sp. SPR117]|uniref:hypothetical protein n=1 Tax=Rhizorhapis sp. SPR117 TaxID=2912611 RepID=UPI001F34245D|nr:hypothetical protein [Rhizorhapis sp. SPR117]
MGASLENATTAEVESRLEKVETDQRSIASDLRVFDTISIDRVIARVTAEQSAAVDRARSAEVRLGRARNAETRAKSIYDAARRALLPRPQSHRTQMGAGKTTPTKITMLHRQTLQY